MKKNKNNEIKFRINFIGVIFSVILLVIASKAIYLQVFCHSFLSEIAANQCERFSQLQGSRGTIYDIKHREMAISNDAVSIAAYPHQADDAETIAEVLAKILRLDAKMLQKKFKSNKSFVWIKRKATPKEAQKVKQLQLKWINFTPERKRFYPNRVLAAQVLGFSGTDGGGLEGVEFFHNAHLEGLKSKFKIVKDALGRNFDAKKGKEACNGNNIVLTIDRTIQFIAEKALKDTVVKFSANSGMAIVMVPKTGAVLAMAHYPFFNPNSFTDFDNGLWKNRTVTDSFEPGSTMKIFSAAAAIESGACSLNSIFFCENGAYKIGRNTIHDLHSYGWLSLQNIVRYSSNIGVVKISEAVGAKNLYNTLCDFGFRSKTGIDCSGEASGSLLPYNRWSKIDNGAISFGQGISVSAIQLASAVSAIANDGILMKPHIVSVITDQNEHIIQKTFPNKIRRVISAETANVLKIIMKSVVSNGGTGANAALESYAVCGKTGTAQKIDENGVYTQGKYTASFIGFAPADEPEITVVVVIDEPKKPYYGGIVAAPAFRKIAYETLNYMNVPIMPNNFPNMRVDNQQKLEKKS